MQDRLKFRVWDKANKCYVEHPDILHITPDGEVVCGFYNGDVEDMFYLPEEEMVVEFSTGLRDRNGNIIHANDIIKDPKGQYGEVFWHKSKAAFYVNWRMRDGSFETDDCIEYGVIVGNVHENHELLEKNDE